MPRQRRYSFEQLRCSWTLLLLVLLSTTACGAEPAAVSTTLETPQRPTPTAIVANPANEPDAASTAEVEVFFPQQDAVPGGRAVMEALLTGELVEVDGCLRVHAAPTSYLVVWPPEATLQAGDDAIQVLDSSG